MSFFVKERKDATQDIFSRFLEELSGREDYLEPEGFESRGNVFITSTGLTTQVFENEEKELDFLDRIHGDRKRMTEIASPIDLTDLGDPIKKNLILQDEFKYGIHIAQYDPKGNFYYVYQDTLILSKSLNGLRKTLGWFFDEANKNNAFCDSLPLSIRLSIDNNYKIIVAFKTQEQNINQKYRDNLPEVTIDSFNDAQDVILAYIDREKDSILSLEEKRIV